MCRPAGQRLRVWSTTQVSAFDVAPHQLNQTGHLSRLTSCLPRTLASDHMSPLRSSHKTSAMLHQEYNKVSQVYLYTPINLSLPSVQPSTVHKRKTGECLVRRPFSSDFSQIKAVSFVLHYCETSFSGAITYVSPSVNQTS